MGHINIQRLEMSGPYFRALAPLSRVALRAVSPEGSGGAAVTAIAPIARRDPAVCSA
jgi:hypothetical protein